MINLPSSTRIKKIIFKKQLYEAYAKDFNPFRKERFDRDISKITITNEISEQSVNVSPTEKIPAIFVVTLDLKNKECHNENLILLSKLLGHKMIFLLHYEDEYSLAIYEAKVHRTEWRKEEPFDLKLSGLNIQKVWENLVAQIANITLEGQKSLEEQIELQILKDNLIKEIQELERKSRREIQSKKKFELYKKKRELEKKLESL